MAQQSIGTNWTRESRNAMESNFDELYASLIGAGKSAAEAERLAKEAVITANKAKEESDRAVAEAQATQRQLDDIVLDDGTGNAEVIQARDGEPLLKDRLNKFDQQIVSTNQQLADIAINANDFKLQIPEVDDVPRLQRAVNFANAEGYILNFSVGEYHQKTQVSINVPSNTTLIGRFKKTNIIVDPVVYVPVFTSADTENIMIDGFNIDGGGSTGVMNYGILLKKSHKSAIRNININNAGFIGIRAIDCDYTSIDRIHVEYPLDRYIQGKSGYAVLLDGCLGCKVSNSTAKRVHFGFLSIGNDGNGTNSHLSERSYEEAYGNIIDNCHVDYHTAVAFDLNSVPFNTAINCTSDHQEVYGGSKSHAFQNKNNSSTGSNSANSFINCTARNCFTAFHSLNGSKVRLVSFTGENVEDGILLNGLKHSTLSDVIIDGYSGVGMKLQNRATGNDVRVKLINPKSNLATIGVNIENSPNNTFDSLDVRVGTHRALVIDDLSPNNKFSDSCRLYTGVIEDKNISTIYPERIEKEVNLAVGGNFFLGHHHRGFNIAKIEIIRVDDVVGGSPALSLGIQGNAAKFINAQTINNTSPVFASYNPPTNSYTDPFALLRYYLSTPATSGKVFVRFSGFEAT